MRIFFSVGEPSGDLHGSNLIRRLKSQDSDIEFVGYGGPKMEAAGCSLHYELTTLAVMFLEALKSIRFFFKLIADADEYFANNQVDAVVLIDYPGFNWWIARKAKRHGIPVYYYGTPQVWAWAPWRVRKIRKFVDHVLCKLPFEVEWFAQRKCHATYVGHPYFDQLVNQTYDSEFMESISNSGTKVLTLLPGSRDQEVKQILPVLIDAARNVHSATNCRIAIASYNERQREVAQTLVVESGLPIEVYVNQTPELMKVADVCIACSGSVSMELLHHRKPTVIVYKVKRWVMFAQALLLRTKFITLVNLIATDDIKKKTWLPFDPDADSVEEPVMPEYLTTKDPAKRVSNWVVRWLTDEKLYQEKVERMNDLASRYAKPGATDRAADYILAQLRVDQKKSEDSEELNQDNASTKTNSRSAA